MLTLHLLSQIYPIYIRKAPIKKPLDKSPYVSSRHKFQLICVRKLEIRQDACVFLSCQQKFMAQTCAYRLNQCILKCKSPLCGVATLQACGQNGQELDRRRRIVQRDARHLRQLFWCVFPCFHAEPSDIPFHGPWIGAIVPGCFQVQPLGSQQPLGLVYRQPDGIRQVKKGSGRRGKPQSVQQVIGKR